MIETITAVNQAVNQFIWGVPAMVCIIGVGLLLSVRTGFLQIRKFPYAIRTTIGRMFRKKDASDGTMTPFQAVCTALAATVGTGNIAGVAGAIAIGGPGAVFWMWCSALLGMCTKFSEVTLAVHFRERNKNGELVGGPMYYIKNGLGQRWQFLAVLYSLFGVLTVFGTGNATQVNTIVTAIDSAVLAYNTSVKSFLPTLNLIVGVVVAMLVAMVLLGGIKRIGSVTEKLVPVMAALYLLGGLVVLVCRIRYLPEAVGMIFRYAFVPNAIIGGSLGYALKMAVSQGVKRGLFSNEAGMGSTPHAHAMAKVKRPHEQGVVAMTGVFIDTFVVLTMTALVVISTLYAGNGILSAGAAEGVSKANMAQLAFGTVLGSRAGSMFVAVCLLFFAFSTILSWNFFGRLNVSWLLGEKAVGVYSVLAIGFIFLGSCLSNDLVWELADLFNQLMVLPNVLALVTLGGLVAAACRRK